MKTAERRQLTPDLVARFPRPGMAIPGKLHYSPDATFISYLFSQRGDLVRDLWRIDLATGKTSVAAPVGMFDAHGGPGFAFYDGLGGRGLKLIGDCPTTHPSGGDAMR